MISADDKRATLLTLYPLFKDEVYRRREQMMRWTAIGAGSLVTILLLMLLVPTARPLPSHGRILLCAAVLLLTATFIMLIHQQRQRHRQAKQTLIELERALGLFEDKAFISHGSVYPENWQTDWQHDRSTNFSFALLGLLTALVLLTVALLS